MSLDLNKLANKLDETLSNETTETLTKFLTNKRMSNNKQSMKLYTEEQVLKMLEVCRDSDLYEHILTFEDILKTETPIELPSDEEIYINSNIESDNVEQHIGFIKGLELMRELIQGGIDGD